MTAVIIITFNKPEFLQKQIDLFRKFVCNEIKVVDNSTDVQKAKEIKEICERNGVELVKVIFMEADASKSHGLALNCAFKYFSNYDRILLADHDLFPFKNFELIHDLAGVPQTREHYNYLWVGLLMISPVKYPNIDLMPFTTESGLNLDTGGMLWNLFDEAVKFDERYEDYEHGNYSVIADSFMHFRNGSNWLKKENHENEVLRLLEILEEKTR